MVSFQNGTSSANETMVGLLSPIALTLISGRSAACAVVASPIVAAMTAMRR